MTKKSLFLCNFNFICISLLKRFSFSNPIQMQKIFYLLGCLFAANILFAQTGIIQGKVTDEKGEALTGATVKIVGSAKHGAITDVEGMYRLALPVGTYDIETSYIGYVTKKITNIKVESGKLAKLDFALNENSRMLESVVVTGEYVAKRKETAVYSIEKVETKALRGADVTKSAKKAAPKSAIVSKSSATTRSAAPTAAPPPPAMYMYRSEAKMEVFDSKIATKEVLNAPLKDKTTTSSGIVSMEVVTFADELSKPDPTSLEAAIAAVKTKTETATTDESLPDEPEERAGQLTAGEWSDLKNWNFWLRSIDTAFSTYHKNWKYNFDDRYSVQVVGSENQPIADAQVRLVATDGSFVWESRTDNHGNAELWSGLFGAKYTNLVFKVLHNGKTFDFKNAKTFKTSVNTLKINASCSALTGLDIAFVVDATGSMGDEIAYLKSEVVDVIRRVKMNNQSLDIRTASVFYKDFSDEYVTRIFPFGKSLKQNLAFIRNQSAGGGGDFEEAVPEGLEAGIDSLKWSEKALARIMFLILDAPPHLTPENVEKLHRLTQKAAQKGIRMIPITASGIDKNVEYLMKTLGVTTGGTYVFLTDDSGIGGSHIKATTEKHEVEHLNDLMVRLIKEATDTEICRRLAEKAATGGDAILDASFKLSPTPASSMIYVDMKNDIESLRITNVHGQMMEDLYDLKAGTKEIAVSTWASGVYYATVKQGNTVSTKKFSVIR
jgi:hypothetical protein